MERLEAIPEHIKKFLAQHEIWPAAIKLFAGADLSTDGDFCETWIAVTDDALVLVKGPTTGILGYNGAGKNSSGQDKTGAAWNADAFETYPLSGVEALKVENLASSSILIMKTEKEEMALCCFTNSHSRNFRLMSKLIGKVKEGKELEEKDFSDEQPPAYCPTCGMLYPEQERRICPKCLDRRSIFRRVLSFVPRYKVQTSLILLCMFLSAALNLLGPYLGGQVLFD
jgi:ATP-binding cassette subfamily B protein